MSNYFDHLLDLATPVEKMGFNVLFCTKGAVLTSKNCALLGKNMRLKSEILKYDSYTMSFGLKFTHLKLEMWANAQRDGRPPEHRWRALFNAA